MCIKVMQYRVIFSVVSCSVTVKELLREVVFVILGCNGYNSLNILPYFLSVTAMVVTIPVRYGFLCLADMTLLAK